MSDWDGLNTQDIAFALWDTTKGTRGAFTRAELLKARRNALRSLRRARAEYHIANLMLGFLGREHNPK